MLKGKSCTCNEFPGRTVNKLLRQHKTGNKVMRILRNYVLHYNSRLARWMLAQTTAVNQPSTEETCDAEILEK